MKKNDLFAMDSVIYRVLDIQQDKLLVIDCIKMNMPKWILTDSINTAVNTVLGDDDNDDEMLASAGSKSALSEVLKSRIGFVHEDIESVSTDRRRIMYQRYTMIAGILPFVADVSMRSYLIARIAEENNISKQSVRSYLCRYLALNDIRALLPKEHDYKRELTQDEKNMRWSLNKYFYTPKKNSLNTAYKLMLKEKYCDGNGKLVEQYPTFNQYRYFYRKTRKMQNYYISRNGLTNYQRNNRPCLGDGIQEYAPVPGTGMVDATPCDIYLVNDIGQVVGRPLLTACIDAYSGMCYGYSLSWEGGIYSVKSMLINIIADKKEYCRRFGISIENDGWSNTALPGRIVSDQGSEYIGYNFEQLAELGITVVNLPSYRPELKGIVEKFFDVVQNEFKPHLKGKGVIEPDFQERGAHDYRKDACLTLSDFEKIVVRCIVHYNSKHVIENYPFTDDMFKLGVQPYASNIFNYGLDLPGTNLIKVSERDLVLCMLPRTTGRFSRFGLKVNKLRYKYNGCNNSNSSNSSSDTNDYSGNCTNDNTNNYTEEYLSGKEVTVAYDPDNVSSVWLIEDNDYVRFELIDSRFEGKELAEVEIMLKKKNEIIREEERNRLQADIDLMNHIQDIADTAESVTGRSSGDNSNIKNIRSTRKKEELNTHIEYAKEAGLHDGI